MPLVGIDGLDALAHHASKKLSDETQHDYLAVLLNAYNNDVFYAVYDSETLTDLRGVEKIDSVLGSIAERCRGKTVAFVGNGVTLHQEKILAIENIAVTMPDVGADVAPVETVAELGLAAWVKNPTPAFSLKPQYLKTQVFAKQKQRS